MSGYFEVYDTEGRIYGIYPDRDQARDAASSASRGYPWRQIDVRLLTSAGREAARAVNDWVNMR